MSLAEESKIATLRMVAALLACSALIVLVLPLPMPFSLKLAVAGTDILIATALWFVAARRARK